MLHLRVQRSVAKGKERDNNRHHGHRQTHIKPHNIAFADALAKEHAVVVIAFDAHLAVFTVHIGILIVVQFAHLAPVHLASFAFDLLLLLHFFYFVKYLWHAWVRRKCSEDAPEAESEHCDWHIEAPLRVVRELDHLEED